MQVYRLTHSVSTDSYAQQLTANILTAAKLQNSDDVLKKEAQKQDNLYSTEASKVTFNEKADIAKAASKVGTFDATYNNQKYTFSCYGMGYGFVTTADNGELAVFSNKQYQTVVCATVAAGYAIEMRINTTTEVDSFQGNLSDKKGDETPKANTDYSTAMNNLRDNFATKLPFTFKQQELKV